MAKVLLAERNLRVSVLLFHKDNHFVKIRTSVFQFFIYLRADFKINESKIKE